MGLLTTIQAASVPVLELFKSFSWELCKDWDVYAVVLKKSRYTPLLNIHSATGNRWSMRTCIRSYAGTTRYIRERSHFEQVTLDKGYVFINIGLLAFISHPEPDNLSLNRHLMVALEAVFSFTLWSLYSKAKAYQMDGICL